jgi:RNA polymerase sigma-70 factor (ECF subfamily)
MDDDGVVPIAELVDERRYLLEVALRLLGNRGDAESAVDETYRLWYGLSEAQRGGIQSPRAWLARVASDVCLTRLPPARVAGDTGPDAETDEEQARTDGKPVAAAEAATEDAKSTRHTLLEALDSLSPAERTAFAVNDGRAAPRGTVADSAERTGREHSEATGQARQRMRERPSQPAARQEHDTVVHSVLRALESEDGAGLESLLSPDATAYFDGGGKVRAPTAAIRGSRRAARSLVHLLPRHPHTTLTPHSINARTGLVARYHSHVAAIIMLGISDQRVTQIWVILNPDKLRPWNRDVQT